MLSFAILLVFIAAILHVTWNVKLQSEDDPLDTSTKAVILGLICLTPLVLAYWFIKGSPVIPWQAWWFALLSGVAELGYFYFLSYSYRHGQLSVVYPIARGSAPVLSVIFGVFFLQEKMSNLQVVGVICLLLGIWIVRGAQVHGKKGVIPALVTGLFIAMYTVIDKVGIGYTNSIFYGELKYLFTALSLAAFISFRHQLMNSGAAVKAPWKKIAFIGICIIVTYQLVLFALTMAPVAVISPLRESASVMVTIWSVWKLKERDGLIQKVVGVLAIFTGIVLLAV